MKIKEHAALARLLMKRWKKQIPLRKQLVFGFGCIEPDINLLTYLRGSRQHKKLYGHNAENTESYVCRQLDRLEAHKYFSTSDWFRFGTVIHYTADAFTYPHNQNFRGSLMEHIQYEEDLEPVFLEALQAYDPGQTGQAMTLQKFYRTNHEQYCGEEGRPETDSRYIISVCDGIFSREMEQIRTKNEVWEGMQNEDTYYHGLV